MERHSAFIIGDSLFAETLGYMLASSEAVEVIGSAPTPEAALAQIAARRPEVVILAGDCAAWPAALCQLLVAVPDLRVIRADLAEDTVQVIISRRIGTHTSELLALIHALPWRDADY